MSRRHLALVASPALLIRVRPLAAYHSLPAALDPDNFYRDLMDKGLLEDHFERARL